MGLEDIANLLAEKINQAHYIRHYLDNVYVSGFEKGKENKENFAIGFVEWFSDNYLKYHDHGMHYTTKELLEIYKKTL